MLQVLVSIIVPIYNVERYLGRCLNSIKRQSYSNIEVIMVNDGSTDSSRKIALDYQEHDNRFRLFDKANGGLSSSRNYGMNYINGDFVCFVDSDDFLTIDYVETLLNSFTDDIDIVVGDYAIYNGKAKKSYLHGSQYKPGVYNTMEEKKQLLLAMFRGFPVMSVWKNMYRASFLRENHLSFISERLVYAEDKLFHVEAYTVARGVKIIDNIVFFHLIISGSLSQSYRKDYFEMHKELRYRITKLLEKYYDKCFVEEYKKMIPSEIGGDFFHMSKCNFKQAVSNVQHILNDSAVVNIYRNKQKKQAYIDI